jgi:hypothetical protein
MAIYSYWSRCDTGGAAGEKMISTACIVVSVFGRSPDLGPHTVYVRPDFPDLRATVGRHRSLAKGYATTAVRLIDSLRARQVEPESGQERGG